MLWRLLKDLFFSGRKSDSPADATERADGLIAEGHRADSRGDAREACEHYRKAVDCAPRYPAAHFNLGAGLAALGDIDGAIGSFRAALAFDPENALANYNLGNLLFRRGALEEAGRCVRRAIELKLELPEAYVVLSEVLRKLWRLEEAEAALRRAIEIDPRFFTAYRNLGVVLLSQSRVDEAVKILKAGQKLDPGGFDLESAELFALNFSEKISCDDLFSRHEAFGTRLEKAYRSRFEPFRNAKDPDRRLRIGYVSSDFYAHPVSLFLTPVLERHDRSAYEIHCYSVGDKVDGVTRQLRSRADVWREAASMSDTGLAETINRDGIDVLVDLSGHSGVFRLAVFAQQPAPVQVTWLGYLSTTGMTRIQYRLCDRHTDPPGMTDRFHTETLVRLPGSQWCYRPVVSVDCSDAPPVGRNGFVTFGSFNDVSKVSPSVRGLWAEILARLPDSRIFFAGVPQGTARDGLIRDFESAGIAADRITIAPRVGIAEYFRSFNDVDIALDTTPYSGGTTTCDALWMGVPVITVPGTQSISRSAASILSTVGLPAWIASTPEQYVRLAVESARDPSAVCALRSSLRERMRASPLMDEARFARDLEAAYRGMWRAWCAGPASESARRGMR
ncbi:MAG TPA: tetratricopeptide repeat protein [Burkholderiales bacterium]|nr:tetratricopeptide repeat protein [Burkholderiales bacterium]